MARSNHGFNKSRDAAAILGVLVDDANKDDGRILAFNSTSGKLEYVEDTAAGAEANTASNVGSLGVGVFDGKVGVDLQFRKINSLSNRFSVALDGPNQKIDIDVVEANLSILSSQISDADTPEGVPLLDGSGLIKALQLPPLAITNTFVVASEAAMLALTAETGDVAVRIDLNENFILQGSDPSVLGNWIMLLTPTDAVLSVNGQTGVVVLGHSDLDSGIGTNTHIQIDTHIADATIHFTAASIGLNGLTNNSVLRANGVDGIQDTTSNALLTDSGQLQISAFIVTGTGNAATPSHTWIGDQTSGDYRVAGDGFAASAAGSKIQHWRADGSIEFFGLLNHTIAGDQILLSQDLSPYREGSHSVLTSGDIYSLNNQRIMKYQSHNVAVDANGDFLARDEAGDHCQLVTFLENGHIHYYHTTNTTGVPVWKLTWGINIANSTTGSGENAYTILSQIVDGASAVGIDIKTENSLIIDGAKVMTVSNNGAEQFFVGIDNGKDGVWANRFSLGAGTPIHKYSFLNIVDTMVVDFLMPNGTGAVTIDATMEIQGAIKTAAAFSGKGTVIGSGVLPFVSGMLFTVDQQGTGSWGASGSWGFGQIPAVISSRYTSQPGSVSMGGFVTNMLAGLPTLDGGKPSDIYISFAAAPIALVIGIPRPVGLYVESQDGTVEGTGVWIKPASHVGIKLEGDGAGSDITFGAGNDASILYDGTNQVYNSQIVGSGYHDFIGGMKVTGNLGFYGTAPIAKAANTVAINDVLVNLGLRASGGFSNFSTTIFPRAGATGANTSAIKFTSGDLMTNPEPGALEFANQKLYLTGHDDHRTVIAMVDGVKLTTTEVVDTLVETELHSHTIVANELTVGTVMQVRGLGRYSKSGGSEVLTLRFKNGATTLATFVSPTGSATDQPIDLRMTLTCRTTGTTGTVTISLETRMDGQLEWFKTTPTAVFNTTIDNILSLTAQWDTANAGSTAQLDQSFITWG